MNKQPSMPRPERISYTKYRQAMTRQIILPVAFVAVMVIVLAALTVFAFQHGSDVGKWASVAIIWMVIPLMGLMLVILAVSWGVVYLMGRLLQISPRYTGIAQTYVLRFNTQIIRWVDKIIQPILKVKAWLSLFSKAEKQTEEAPHVQEKSNRRL